MALQFTPESIVYLLNVPMSADQKNQIDFASVGAQSAYFHGRIVRSFTDFTYQRKDHIIRVPVEADAIWNCNYVMYQNANFTNKWFYAFITEIEYRNDGCCWLHIKTDVFQTWLFNFVFKQCFVEREHVSEDTPYLHTQPENLPIGDLYACREFRATPFSLLARDQAEFDANYYVCICMSDIASYVGGSRFTAMIGGAPNACNYYCVDTAHLAAFIDAADQAGEAESIVAIFPIPRGAVYFDVLNTVYVPKDHTNITAPMETTFDLRGAGYLCDGTPIKNNKLKSFPYTAIRLHNNSGSSIDLKPQDFYNLRMQYSTEIKFETNYATAPNGSLIVSPRFYRQSGAGSADINDNDFMHSVEFNAFPQIAWTTDTYKNYAALNSNSLAMQQIELGVQSVTAGASGDASGVLNAALSAVDFYAGQIDREAKPRQMRGKPSAGVDMLSGSAGVFVSFMRPTDEYLKMADAYFSAYGYAVNIIKTPSFKTRPAWNYLKTRDCILDCDCPEDDAQELESIFNSGVTIWHTAAGYGNYDQNNS